MDHSDNDDNNKNDQKVHCCSREVAVTVGVAEAVAEALAAGVEVAVKMGTEVAVKVGAEVAAEEAKEFATCAAASQQEVDTVEDKDDAVV
ncbi:unnamed protein product [Toxocara canis]|uniref:Uncharacterized protein n=1 Tax=Toxocara canis TaxID=6265 RepID=A0A183VEL5_TOXCA|nr:unnamed protein product [Toxocara canis]